MAIRHAGVDDYVLNRVTYEKIPGKMYGGKPIHHPTEWCSAFLANQSLDDTYIIIFGPLQDEYLEGFERLAEKHGVKILFKSEKAYNYNYNGYARNTLVIFELEQLLQV